MNNILLKSNIHIQKYIHIIYTYIHTHTYKHIHIYITHLQTYTYIHKHIQTIKYIRNHIQSNIYVNTNNQIYTSAKLHSTSYIYVKEKRVFFFSFLDKSLQVILNRYRCRHYTCDTGNFK